MNNIIPVYDLKKLGETIENYNKIVKNKNADESSNNSNFNEQLERIVEELV